MSNENKALKSITLTAMFSAIIAICSWITIPITIVPFTLQTFAVAISVCMLGTAWFIYVYTNSKGAIGIISALSTCVFPYIIPDILKFSVAILISNRLYKFTKD